MSSYNKGNGDADELWYGTVFESTPTSKRTRLLNDSSESQQFGLALTCDLHSHTPPVYLFNHFVFFPLLLIYKYLIIYVTKRGSSITISEEA